MKNFIDWYLSLFTNSDPKVILAAVSTTLAIVVALINYLLKPLWNFIKKKSTSVEVEMGMTVQILQTGLAVSTMPMILYCKITNKGSESIYIENPTIILSKKIQGYKTFSVPVMKDSFPLKLEGGEKKKFEYSTIPLNKHILVNLEDEDKIGFLIETTLHKKYFSNLLTKKHMVDNMKLSRSYKL